MPVGLSAMRLERLLGAVEPALSQPITVRAAHDYALREPFGYLFAATKALHPTYTAFLGSGRVPVRVRNVSTLSCSASVSIS